MRVTLKSHLFVYLRLQFGDLCSEVAKLQVASRDVSRTKKILMLPLKDIPNRVNAVCWFLEQKRLKYTEVQLL